MRLNWLREPLLATMSIRNRQLFPLRGVPWRTVFRTHGPAFRAPSRTTAQGATAPHTVDGVHDGHCLGRSFACRHIVKQRFLPLSLDRQFH